MKPTRHLARALGICALAGAPLFAQTVEIDPVDPLIDATSLADWNTDGDLQGWVPTRLTPTVAGGLLTFTTDAVDPFLVLNPLNTPIPTGTPSKVAVEFKLQRSATDVSDMQVFWRDAAGAFAGTRSLTLPGAEVPTDGLPHVYRFNLNNVNTNLIGLRIDPGVDAGTDYELDYVNVKVNSGGPIIDPTDLVNNFTSLGEWNTADDFEGWTTNPLVASPNVSSGILSGISTGNDPQVVLEGINLDTDNGENQVIEIRFRRQSTDTGRIDLFWSDPTGGYGTPRRASIPDNAWPTDGEFHVVQFPLGDFITGNLINLRFDPVANNANSISFALDYVRIGNIDADDDNDGLANSVETNTGTYNGPNDTGTDPNNNDTDGDTFLDGVEVAFGTNPLDINDFPAPALTAYSGDPANYVVDIAITPNNPTVVNGTPTGFTVSPALPAGLTLDPASGVISGTATATADSADYTVTATFDGGLTSTFDLTLEVVNPGIASYSINSPGYNVGETIDPNAPTTFGAAPDSFTIAPALPAGLFLDGTTGIITGTPTEVSPQAPYLITAGYTSYPDATFTLNLQIKAIPAYIGSDNEPLGMFASLGEWETDGDLEGWNTNAGKATATAAGGILTFTATAPDPQLFKGGGIDITQGQIIEIRSRQNDTEPIQFFWADASGGYGGGRSFIIGAENIIPDGEFHTYQVNMTDVFVGDVSSIRFDPGNIAGRSVDIDYIRIGTATPPGAPLVTAFSHDPTFGEISITWTSVQGANYLLEGSADLQNWAEIDDGLTGDTGSTTAIITVPEEASFFRIVRVIP
ncbi:MAG: putative Ig domain-containing protein [Verrucomicrobiaceae bacterium]